MHPSAARVLLFGCSTLSFTKTYQVIAISTRGMANREPAPHLLPMSNERLM